VVAFRLDPSRSGAVPSALVSPFALLCLLMWRFQRK